MYRIIFLSFFILIFSILCKGQEGKVVSNVNLIDANNKPTNIPYLWQKTFVLFYVDPDVQEITDPISDALNAKKYPVEKFGAVGVVNCKDSWFPNGAILSRARQKQKKFPESLILIDKNQELRQTWGFSNYNDVAVIVVVGKDSAVKLTKTIKSKDEAQTILPEVLKAVETEIIKK